MKDELLKNNPNIRELWKLRNKIAASKDEFIAKRHSKLQEFKHLTSNEIVEKFSFKKMQINSEDFCRLLGANKTCHNMPEEILNCYNCFCPNYLIEIGFDKELNLYKLGFCSINSKFGHYKLSQSKDNPAKDFLILNCVNCNIPHNKIFVEKMIIG